MATAVENWKNAIREAQTFSRMHVLLGMLDASIKWDMSAENARCKVCRRKGEAPPPPPSPLAPPPGGMGAGLTGSSSPPGDDEKLILCDECNKAFHLFCLRPALYRIPVGEWRCLACQPTVARRGSRSRSARLWTLEGPQDPGGPPGPWSVVVSVAKAKLGPKQF